MPAETPNELCCTPSVRLPESGQLLLLDGVTGAGPLLSALAGMRIVFCHATVLDPAMLARIDPDVVVAPVLGPRQDLVEVAQTLSAAGFAGLLCGVATPPVRPALVAREVAASCPDLRFTVVAGEAPG